MSRPELILSVGADGKQTINLPVEVEVAYGRDGHAGKMIVLAEDVLRFYGATEGEAQRWRVWFGSSFLASCPMSGGKMPASLIEMFIDKMREHGGNFFRVAADLQPFYKQAAVEIKEARNDDRGLDDIAHAIQNDVELLTKLQRGDYI